MKKRRTDPPFSTPELGRRMAARAGLGVNLLVREIAPAARFAREVLGADVEYEDEDFALVRWMQAQWMLHADHTYDRHPVAQAAHALQGAVGRGAGAELRLYGCDPDVAQARAQESGFTVLASVALKPHGMREVYIADADGYVWVPSVPA